MCEISLVLTFHFVAQNIGTSKVTCISLVQLWTYHRPLPGYQYIVNTINVDPLYVQDALLWKRIILEHTISHLVQLDIFRDVLGKLYGVSSVSTNRHQSVLVHVKHLVVIYETNTTTSYSVLIIILFFEGIYLHMRIVIFSLCFTK